MPEPASLYATAAQRWPARTAFATASKSLTYADLYERVLKIGGAFAEAGIGKGDRVATYKSVSLEHVLLLAACFETDVVACPINAKLPPASAAALAKRLECRAVITDTKLDKVPVLNPGMLLDSTAPPASPHAVMPANATTLILTSGSTGEPKAAQLSMGNYIANACASNARVPLRGGDCWLLSLPLHHVSGISTLIRCAMAGATVFIPERESPLFESLRAYPVTHVSLVAAQLHRLLSELEGIKQLQKLKAVLAGGGPVPRSLIDNAHDAGVPIYLTYGMTETASQIATNTPDCPPAKRYTAGQALLPDSLRIDENGEIQVRGPSLFQGYLDSVGLSLPLTADGWFRTGDLGRLDAGGYLLVTGRLDNMFISGGENIQPEEIEQALMNIAGIEQAVVVPVDDEVYGARPVAFLRCAGESIAGDEIVRVLKGVLPGHKVPRTFFPWPGELPATLKPSRAELAARAQAHVRDTR